MNTIQLSTFADVAAQVEARSILLKEKNKEEARLEKEKEEAMKKAKKAKKELKKAKKEEKEAKKEVKKTKKKASEFTSIVMPEPMTTASPVVIPEAKCSTRVELIAHDEETGESKVLVSTDYAEGPAEVPPRENVPVVTIGSDGRVEDASLEEKIRAAAARKGITLEASDSPIAAALASASAANVKKGSNAPRNVGRNVVRVHQQQQ